MDMNSLQERARVSVAPDASALMLAAAGRIIDIGQRAIAQHGRFAWALAGGSTPRALYELLTSEHFATALDWAAVELFFGDERCVAPEDAQSNYHMVRESLIDRLAAVSFTQGQLHRMRGEDEPSQAAAAYEAELRAFFAGLAAPRFDLVLLGMGADGHTASLFPDTPALRESTRWVVPSLSPSGAQRLTLTLPVINAAAHVIVLVAGADKAARVREALSGRAALSSKERALPVQQVHPHHGQLEWMLDAQAAGGLT